jgi:DNA helicase HerA-like ATPase
VGDPDKPKLVFFFDEAHLLFDAAPPALLDKVEQVVRLIRSKGVGVYFISQNPLDIPDQVLGQLGNRVQHALRAFTPRDQKAVRAAAQTFRANPTFDTEEVITRLGVGEALVSTLDLDGVPGVVDQTLIRPPCSRMGPITPQERQRGIAASGLGSRYDQPVDRESAYEVLAKRAEDAARQTNAREAEKAEVESAPQARTSGRAPARSRRQSPMEAMISSTARAIGSQIGRQIVRGLLGSFLKR